MSNEKRHILSAILMVLCVLTFLSFNTNYIYGESGSENISGDILNKAGNSLKLGQLADNLESYIADSNLGDIDLKSIGESGVKGKGIKFDIILEKILGFLAKEIIIAIKTGIAIVIILVISAIFKSLELESGSSIGNIVNLVTFMIIVSLMGNTYIEVMKMFIATINAMCSAVQITTPFIIAILIATGGAVTATIVQPLILFIASFIGMGINYFVIPFITVGLTMKIISGMSESIKLDKLGGLFTKTAMWTVTVSFAIFLGIISIEGQIATSVDSVVVKGAQAAVSNIVPVVGKFVADSLELVMGSAEVIGKVGGTIGIIALIILAISPVIKLLLVLICQKIVVASAESLGADDKLVKLVDSFGETYKTMLGILIGVLTIFIISTAIIINLMGASGN